MLRRGGGALAGTVLLVAISAAALLASCSPESGRPAESAATSPDGLGAWDRYVRSFVDLFFELRPHFGVIQGRHEYDGRLADYSEPGLRRWVGVLQEERRQVVDFDRSLLSPEQEFERSHLLARIDQELFRVEKERAPWRSGRYYLDELDPAVYVDRQYAPAVERLRAYVRYAESLPEVVSQIGANFGDELSRLEIEQAVATFSRLGEFLERDVPHTFSGVGDESLQDSFAEANGGAVVALRALVETLEARRATAPETGFALGADRLLEMLWKSERLNVGLTELKAAANQELAQHSEALHQACGELAPDATIEECIEAARVRPDGWQPLPAARRHAREIVGEAVREGIRLPRSDGGADHWATALPLEAVIVRQALPYRTESAASLEMPGPYETGLDAVFRIALPVTGDELSEDDVLAPSDLPVLVAREVAPGRHVQRLTAHRAAREVARVFRCRGFSDGWAHYAVELAHEQDLLGADPANEIAYRLSALTSVVRVLAVLALHAEGVDLTEAERMFRQQARLSDRQARLEGARAATDPRLLHGTLGRLLILRLREDWLFEQGEAGSLAAFHQKLLSYGAPPLVMVREEMVGDTGGAVF